MPSALSRPRLRWLAAPILAGVILAGVILAGALLGGCAPVATRPAGPAVTVPERAPQIEQARELARGVATQTGPTRRASEEQIERLLSQLDNATLAQAAEAMAVGDPLYDYAGRALLRRGLPLPRPFDRSAWTFDATRPPAERDGYRPPVKLAVLLPLSGNLATAASPVRDGFLTAYYGETRRRPEVNFFDTTGGALAAYDRAVAAGSDFVIGPLGREEVGAVFARGQLPVPVLALNRGTVPPPPGNASFSLSPEDEGVAAAEFLLSRNAPRVLAIAGADDTQRRAVAALRERLAERGGSVVAVAGETTEDFAPYAAQAGQVDAIFLAVKGSTARELMPKLALAGLGGKPRVATSQLLSGTGKAEADRVLDGIAFPAETWINRGLPGLASAASVGAALPTARGPAARLFAFGYDAWKLTAYLEHLATSTNGRLEGATGVLRLDGFGNVQRTPAWSTFSGGVAVPLADAGR